MNLSHIHVEDTFWARSLLQRMGFVRRTGTTAKVPISNALKKEMELTFLHDVVNVIEKHNIPPSLVINLAQTLHQNMSLDRSLQWPKWEQKMYLLLGCRINQ